MINNKNHHINEHDKVSYHRRTEGATGFIAYSIVYMLARMADLVFRKKYGHRAVVLETVAAVPGLIGGFFQHLKAIRLIRDDNGWIRELLDEAENERMHLMIFSHIIKPTYFERLIIIVTQFLFATFYFIVYIISPKLGHRTIGYFEEQAIHSYNIYLHLIEDGEIHNIKAPQIAIDYYNLPEDALLTDVIIEVRKDEMKHRDVNHTFADKC